MTDPTLTEALATMGYTTRPSMLQGRRDVLDGLGSVVVTGTAEDVWAWVHMRQHERWAAGIWSAERAEELIAQIAEDTE